MPASPLTDERWTGLPLLACDMDPGLYRMDVDVPQLIIRDDPGTQVEVVNHADHQARFRQAPLRFDLFTGGLRVHATSDRKSTMSFVVALTDEWLPADGWAFQPRFQFGDVVLRRLVWRLGAHHRGGEPLGPAYNRAVSRAIVDRLIRLQVARDARHPDSVGLRPDARRLVQALIDANLEAPPSAAALAAKVGMGQVRFVREFQVTFCATPHQFVMQRRLMRAREMLASTDASLATIAIETGFASHAHFSTVFRAMTGTTPSAYRGASGARRSALH